jgi:conjugative transfer signal peptidase TraF
VIGKGKAVATIGVGAGVIALLFVAGCWGGLRINFTPSYPLGLWRVTPLDRPAAVGDRIFICPPQTGAFGLALERGYVRHGLCPGWISPLIKTVAAVAGERIEVGQSVRVDGRPLDHSEIHAVDAEGRALPRFGGGIVPAGQLFLHSDFAGSYDSRYFGPISADGILGLAQPLLTVAP